jgi:gamma-glutamyltranspeptidase / glutathione hydrolase
LCYNSPSPTALFGLFLPSQSPPPPQIVTMALLRAVTAAQLLLLLPGMSSLVSAAPYGTNATSEAPTHGAVASESAVCSDIGIKLLEQGGNAIDALVGTVFCVGTIGMYHSGIGGGGFMLVRAPNGTYEFIDFRETAGAAYTQDMYVNDTDLSLYGGLAA